MKREWVVIFLLAGGGAAACFAAAGASAGLFFGGFFISTFLAPIYVGRGLMAVVAASLAIALVWLIGAMRARDPIGQWLSLAVLLFVYGFLLQSAGNALRKIGIGRELGAAMVMLVALAWLTWPIWLRPAHGVSLLIELHPPLVANGVLTREEPWTERTVAYELTNLNQDVPIRLPDSVLPCGGACMAAGLALWGLAHLSRSRLPLRDTN